MGGMASLVGGGDMYVDEALAGCRRCLTFFAGLVDNRRRSGVQFNNYFEIHFLFHDLL